MPERPTTESGGTASGAGVESQARAAREEQPGDEKQELIQEMLRRENMLKAYQRVVRNGGAPGVDGMTVEDLMPYCREHWEQIRERILNGTYVPQAVRRVEIPKPDGQGTRTLGIPTVMDRMIQQAVAQVLQPIFEPTFSESSFGFRPGRSQHGAVLRAYEYMQQGFAWVVDLDVEKFFDRVNHDVLMARVARRVKDKPVLLLIRRFLQAGMMDGGLVSPRTEGTPQGSPLSPLLSNILLDELDKELERRGARFVRYADDCNVYVRSKAAGERVMASLERFLYKRLRLKINRDKSAVARPSERKFLAYSVSRQRKPQLMVAPKSVQRLKTKLKPLFRQGRGMKLADTIERINRITRGWVAYFRLSGVKESFGQLDGWIRRHLRDIQWRQWKTPRTRLKKLLKLGVPIEQAKSVYNRVGPWRNAAAPHMHTALPNAALSSMGLVSLLADTGVLRALRESPDAERHVRWCGGWGPATVPGHPIRQHRPTL
jgi:RNA-directed DNA polymerase